MKRLLTLLALAALLLVNVACGGRLDADTTAPKKSVDVNQIRVQRGAYLVAFGGCNDCHTPLKMGPRGPEPDMTRMLSGHPEQFKMPKAPETQGAWMWHGAATNTAFAGPWGISYARNLTPDQVTGLGIWTEEMFVKTMRTGRHMGVSRPILPPMPWQNLNNLNDEDLKSVFAYLKSIKPVRNDVPDAVIAPPPPASAANAAPSKSAKG